MKSGTSHAMPLALSCRFSNSRNRLYQKFRRIQLHRGVVTRDASEQCLQFLPTPARARVQFKRHLTATDASEHRLEAVILFLRDGVELVIVAAGALHREAGEGVHHGRDDVVAVEVACNFAVNAVFANVAKRTFIPRPSREEPQSWNQLRLSGEQHIRRDLLFHEPPVRRVGVERGDEVIAVAPRVGPHAVLIVPVCLREVNRVHP